MTIAEGFLFVTQLLLGKAETLHMAFYRFGIWAILFAAFFNGASRVFRNRNANILIAFILSVLATHLVPLNMLLLLGNVLVIVALIVIPYRVVDRLTKKRKMLKFFFLGIIYLIFIIMISGIDTDIGFINWLYFAGKYFYTAYSLELTILSALLVIYLAFRYTKEAK